MMIALEGAPAVGKSTTSEAIAAHHNAFVVPEVNKLFARPRRNEPKHWYLDRQLARWEMGQLQAEKFDWIIFDGDLFQPLWLNWIYHNEPWISLEECEVFYREQILAERIAFPDMYFLLWTHPQERMRREYKRGRELNREEATITKKYQRYERLVEPQIRYFRALQYKFPEKVKFLESITVETNLKSITSITNQRKPQQNIETFNFLINWLQTNSPEEPG